MFRNSRINLETSREHSSKTSFWIKLWIDFQLGVKTEERHWFFWIRLDIALFKYFDAAGSHFASGTKNKNHFSSSWPVMVYLCFADVLYIKKQAQNMCQKFRITHRQVPHGIVEAGWPTVFAFLGLLVGLTRSVQPYTFFKSLTLLPNIWLVLIGEVCVQESMDIERHKMYVSVAFCS